MASIGATVGLLARSAVRADMKMVVVGARVGRLLKHVRRSSERARIRLVRDAVTEEARLAAPAHEEPLNRRLVVEHL